MGDFLAAFIGLCAGLITGGTICAFFVALGVFSKSALCVKYQTSGMEMAISSAFGSIVGTLITLFNVSIMTGVVVTAIFGLLSGVYIGIFIACLAEVTNMIPMLKSNGLNEKIIIFVLLGFVLGKLSGSLVYWISDFF